MSKVDMDEMQRAVGNWGKETFPDSTISTITLHLLKEARELVSALEEWEQKQKPVKDTVVWPTAMEEVADVVLLSLHLAHRKGFSLYDVIENKFRICQTREWGEPDDDGVREHIREKPEWELRRCPSCHDDATCFNIDACPTCLGEGWI